MHNWCRVKAGTYHNFHVLWMSSITNRLNSDLLPPGYFAMAEQIVGQPETDVVTLQTGRAAGSRGASNGGVAVATVRPKTRFVMTVPSEQERYARKTNRIAIRHELGRVVSVIELVSPGNKDRQHSLRAFVEKAIDLIRQQVNLLIIDPFPPGPHDPQGIHAAIWDGFADEPFELPADKPLTLAAYQAAPDKTAYVEPIAVGDDLPEMPLFLEEDRGIILPLEDTYQATWNVLPVELRQLLEP
jgi:hypothetical protein